MGPEFSELPIWLCGKQMETTTHKVMEGLIPCWPRDTYETVKESGSCHSIKASRLYGASTLHVQPKLPAGGLGLLSENVSDLG